MRLGGCQSPSSSIRLPDRVKPGSSEPPKPGCTFELKAAVQHPAHQMNGDVPRQSGFPSQDPTNRTLTWPPFNGEPDRSDRRSNAAANKSSELHEVLCSLRALLDRGGSDLRARHATFDSKLRSVPG